MKTGDSYRNVAACDLKVGRCRQLIELMKLFEYRRSRPFFTLTYGHLHMKIQTVFSEKPVGHFASNFVCKPLVAMKFKFNRMMLVT